MADSNNCLRSGHRSHQCKLRGCRICKGKHNTVLHNQSSLPQTNRYTQSHNQPLKQGQDDSTRFLLSTSSTKVFNHDLTSSASPHSNVDSSCVVTMSAVSLTQALLSTALIEVTNNDKSYTWRASLDSGS